MHNQTKQRVLVVGGGTYLGLNIAAALLAAGADVSLIIRPGNEDRLGPLSMRVRWHVADVWDPASLRGRARGAQVVIHTVGSMVSDPARGLTFHRLNVVSARNTANMCISDGVPHLILLSTVRAPWISLQYVRAKREAESYLDRVGLQSSIIRAPLTFIPGQNRALFYRLLSAVGSVPPLSWSPVGRIAPMPLDVLARGVAQIAVNGEPSRKIYYARDLRRLSKQVNHADALADATDHAPPTTHDQEDANPLDLLNDDTPFGWMPLPDDQERR